MQGAQFAVFLNFEFFQKSGKNEAIGLIFY
jgi:hypothetical protein